jgi:hypothetical protein
MADIMWHPLRRRLSRAWSGALPEPQPVGQPERIEVCPPELLSAVAGRGWLDSTRQLLLRRPTPASRQPQVLARLPAARDDFVASVADIACSGELRQRLQHARSLRELWHLRAEVFERVSLHYDQGEAQARLARLNCHFPIRSPRSGVTPL